MPMHAAVRPTVDEALGTLVAAFSSDPVIRWFFPVGHQYLTAFPELLGLMIGPAFADGTVDTAGGGAGTAAWLEPGTVLPQKRLADFVERAIAPDRVEDAMVFLEQLDLHHPDWPIWYLPFLGVDPVAQGRGIGGALLGVGTDRADRDGLPAYLEATSPRNRALYERHGFRIVGEVQVADSPPLWPMLRRPS